MSATPELRKQVADLARDFRAGCLDFRTFMMNLPSEAVESEDETISELMILVEHEPGVDGLLGVRRGEHDAHVERIDALIEELAGDRQ